MQQLKTEENRMIKKTLKILSSVVAAVVMGLSVTTAHAATNFEGETVTIVIPFKEGGGTSRMFRFFQPYLSKHLPGNPVIQLQHMPGGGTIKGGNFFHENQNPDGTFLLATSSSVNMQQATGNPLAKFDLLSYEPVLSVATTTHWVTHSHLADGPNDISGLLELPVALFPFKTAASADLFHLWIYKALGVKGARPIPGLSSSAGYQSFQRGELQMASHGTSNFLKTVSQDIADGKVHQFMTLGVLQPDGSVQRPSYSPDAMTFPEMYEKVHGKVLEGDERAAYEVIAANWGPASKGLVLPTDTPAEIVDVWRGAIKKMTEDPDFIEAAPQNIGPFPVVIGEDVRGIIGKAVDLSDASKQQFNDAIAHYKLTYRIQ